MSDVLDIVFQRQEGTDSGSLVLNLILELAIFLGSEFLLRPFFRLNVSTAQRTNVRFKLLLTQVVVLLLVSCILLLFHHIPYILIAATGAILFRVVQMQWHSNQHSMLSRPPAKSISRPIRNYSSQHGNHHTKQSGSYPVPHQCTDVPRSQNPFVYPNHLHPSSSYSANPGNKPTANRSSSTLALHSKTMDLRSKTVESKEVSFSTTLNQPATESTGSLPVRQPAVVLHSSLKQLQPESILSPRKSEAASFLSHGLTSVTSGSSDIGSLHGLSYGVSEIPSTTPPGLINDGNTCFVNSTLQCLNWTPDFINVLSQLSHDSSTFLSKLNDIFLLCNSLPDGVTTFQPISTCTLLSAMSYVAPHLVAVKNSVQHQQDTAEFLLWILNHLHNALQTQSKGRVGLTDSQIEGMRKCKQSCMTKINQIGSTNLQVLLEPMSDLSGSDWCLHQNEHSSAIHELFLGQILEARECQLCKRVTMNIEYFTLLPLPIIPTANQYSTLDQCFNKFSDAEQLTQDNMIFCSCTKDSLTPAVRLALLSILPKCLIIQLSRFSYSSLLRTAIKNSTPVYFPQHVDFFPHTMKSRLDPNAKQTMHYELHAFCVHTGAQSTSCGHYVAYCKAQNGRWYHYNDQNVTHIVDIDAVLNCEFVLRNAYLLFYHTL